MRKTVIVVLIVVLVSILLAGCSGGGADDSGAQTETQPAQSTDTTAQQSTGSASSATTTSTTTETKKPAVPRELEFTKKSLPAAFEKAVEDGFVVIVALYSEDSISKKVSDSVDEVVKSVDYKDQIKYFSYEIGTKTSSSVAKLTTAINAKYNPNITIIDRDKNIVFEKSGFIEKSFFSHKLYNVVYKDKSPE